MRVLEASCANCRHFTTGTCGLGVVLPEGQKLCDQYLITPTFQQDVISAMLKEKAIEVKVPIAKRAKMAAEKGRPVKGFRALPKSRRK